MTKANVINTITDKLPNMSKSQKKIATYILENPHSAPFLTVGKLAKLAQVSEATVVRFATFLGYSGYNELQQHMYDAVEKQLNTVERLQMSRSVYSETEKGIYEIFEDDIANIQTTMENLTLEDFQMAANYILGAKKIYIVANRSAVSLGTFLQYYLNIILGNSQLITSSESAFEQIYEINKDDVVIGVSFARYTVSTIDVVSHAHKKGSKIIAITDSLMSPINQYATVSLHASSKMPSFLDSFVAPLSIINALIAYIGKQRPKEVNDRLENLEKLWDEYHVFYQRRED
ncbi:MurR/RpiR family transcriptional regulator [Ornithinibacillus halophilus]|uniref:Transcriptional regulator, RpiR family n=1 Tax=Ornithinibacillus halophilus TaxID=930117 RepID=A0A1M5DU74_9BACI|nr:MurR/RpiR family transcriptional regulator [Ornithinibacillus halophilus]SHF70509.1 transcriptional regulator, RpiR family [Ornithinibacillus halophilus]